LPLLEKDICNLQVQKVNADAPEAGEEEWVSRNDDKVMTGNDIACLEFSMPCSPEKWKKNGKHAGSHV
jgi:hypothetical protein